MATYKKGQDFIVYVGGPSEANRVAYSKSCTLEVKTDLIETSSPDTGIWKTSIAGKMSWAVKVSGLVEESRNDVNLWNLMMRRTELAVLYRDTEGDQTKIWQGQGYIKDLQQTATLRETATYSIEIEGTSELVCTGL